MSNTVFVCEMLTLFHTDSRSTLPCHRDLYVAPTVPAHNPRDPSLAAPPFPAPRLALGDADVCWAPGPLLPNDLLQDPILSDAAGAQLASHLYSS